MVQCIGPAEQYCSRLCCTTALKNALKLTEARKAGVGFIHYEFDRKPIIETTRDENTVDVEAPLRVKIWEPVLDRDLELNPDLVVLSMPVIPPSGTQELSSQLKLSLDMDGFFLEAHVKLRPVDMPGRPHSPFCPAVCASRAASVLSQETMLTNA